MQNIFGMGATDQPEHAQDSSTPGPPEWLTMLDNPMRFLSALHHPSCSTAHCTPVSHYTCRARVHGHKGFTFHRRTSSCHVILCTCCTLSSSGCASRTRSTSGSDVSPATPELASSISASDVAGLPCRVAAPSLRLGCYAVRTPASPVSASELTCQHRCQKWGRVACNNTIPFLLIPSTLTRFQKQAQCILITSQPYLCFIFPQVIQGATDRNSPASCQTAQQI